MARYALVVGISEYKSKHLSNLSKPVGDAEAIAALLRAYGGCEQVKVLTGYVSAEQLETALSTLITKKAVRNEVVIYFTGHGFATQGLGGKKGHLATSDCEIEIEAGQPKRQSKAVAFSDLNDLIRASNLSNLVMFLDACHSGEFIESTLVEQSFSAFSAQQDYWLIAACRGFEEAWAKKSEEHSVFTGALLEALSIKNADPDGCITGDLLVEYLRRALKGSLQELVRYGKGRSLPIVRFPLPERSPQSPSPPTASDTADRVIRSSAVPLQMPPLPDHFVERPEQQRRVKEDLLCEGTKSGTLVVSAIYGLGGIGKSVLATKLARDPEVQSHFLDGILWATLGQDPDILPMLSGWIQALGDNDYKPTAIESASNHLRTLLYDKRILLVIDDVWNPEHLEPFRVGGEGSCVLVTTREARISGAHRHELDVMSPEQSLELMTQKLSEPLSDTARQQAVSFAERVGHLPLALELAASQIDDGVTWSELLEDFQSEIVRLDALDVYGQVEIPDEERRRKYSLLACFNLSLRQLSTEQLRQFAWLGIVPEDVSLTKEMAETLWQVTSRQSGSILRTFRAKALVLQGAKKVDERPTYRMHDLMHDLAQQLLTSAPQPLEEGDLPGLGLTKAEAHSELLERYRKKTQKGQWHTLKDDGYIYAYLTWHMEQAKQPQAIHYLLQSDNEEGRNGWYEACDAVGMPSGFVNDIGRAWRLSVISYGQNPEEAVSLLFRYALIRSSLNSLASNVPADLIKGLVENGIWQVAQGVSYAKQAQNPWQRAECISEIIPYIPTSLLPEIIKTINQIQDAAYRSYALSTLSNRFPEVWPDALIAIQQIQDSHDSHRHQLKGFSYRTLALDKVVEQLPPQHLKKAIDIARQVQDPFDKAMALNKLLEKRTELLSEMLDAIRKLKSKSDCAWVLIDLAKHIPKYWPKAIEITHEIKNEETRAWVIRDLMEHLPPEYLSEVLPMRHDFKEEYSRLYVISCMLEHLPEYWPEVLDKIRKNREDYRFINITVELAKHTLPEHLPELFSIVRGSKNGFWSSFLISSIVKNLALEHLPEALEALRELMNKRSIALRIFAERLPLKYLPEVLSMVSGLKGGSYDVICIRVLAERISSEYFSEVLKIARKLKKKRSSVLCALAKRNPEYWTEALESTREIKDEREFTLSLFELSNHVPDCWAKALVEIRNLKDEDDRSFVLCNSVEYLSLEYWPEILAMTQSFKDEGNRSSVLRSAVEYLPLEHWSEVLVAVRKMRDEGNRSSVLRSAVEYLPLEHWSEILSVIRQMKSDTSRSSVLRSAAEYLPLEHWSEALAIVQGFKNEDSRSSILQTLCTYLPSEYWPKVLAMVRELEDEINLSSMLKTLGKYIPPDYWSEILGIIHELEDEDARISTLYLSGLYRPMLWPEVLSKSREIEDCNKRSSVLISLMEHISLKYWPEILAMVRELSSENARSAVLQSLGENIPLEHWPEVLMMVRELEDENARLNFIQNLGENILLEHWLDVLMLVRELKGESVRSNALQSLRGNILLEHWSDVLMLVRELKGESVRADALSSIAENVPPALLSDAIDIAWLIQDKYYSAGAFRSLLSRLEQLSISFYDWARVLDRLAYQNRSSILRALPDSRPTIVRLGSRNTFSEIVEISQDICKQWP